MSTRVVIPLYGFDYVDAVPIVFAAIPLRLERFNKEDIPKIDGLSKLDTYHLEQAYWALVADSDTPDLSVKINMLLLALRIATDGRDRVLVRYKLYPEEPARSVFLRDQMHGIIKDETTDISLTDLQLADRLLSDLLIMDTTAGKEGPHRTHNAIYFLWQGYLARKWMECLILLMTSLESLFSKDNRHGGETWTICSRVEKFLGAAPGATHGEVRELYDLRSSIVHGRVKADSEEGNLEKIRRLESIVLRCFKKMLVEKVYVIYEDSTKKEAYFQKLTKQTDA